MAPAVRGNIPPAEWFADKDVAYLDKHLIPKDKKLWELNGFEDFIVARQQLIRDRFRRAEGPARRLILTPEPRDAGRIVRAMDRFITSRRNNLGKMNTAINLAAISSEANTFCAVRLWLLL